VLLLLLLLPVLFTLFSFSGLFGLHHFPKREFFGNDWSQLLSGCPFSHFSVSEHRKKFTSADACHQNHPLALSLIQQLTHERRDATNFMPAL